MIDLWQDRGTWLQLYRHLIYLRILRHHGQLEIYPEQLIQTQPPIHAICELPQLILADERLQLLALRLHAVLIILCMC
jgi:hypothetical protein